MPLKIYPTRWFALLLTQAAGPLILQFTLHMKVDVGQLLVEPTVARDHILQFTLHMKVDV